MAAVGAQEIEASPPPLRVRPLLIAVLGAGAAIVAGERIWLAMNEPLWLDETWTGAIVSAPGWGRFWREAWLDVNAPLYYVVMRLWTGVFGLSDLSLRIPGLLAVALAAAAPLAARVRGLSVEARLAWAGLIFFWWRAGVFLDARCYGLLLAISTVQVLAFLRLMEAPGRGRALAWCATAALAILTQYYAGFVVLAQGLAFLAAHRGRALRAWPAGLVFAVPAAWIAVHAPRLSRYADPALAWHPAVDLAGAVELAGFVLGASSLGFALALAAILGLGLVPAREESPSQEEPGGRDLWIAVGCGAAAAASAVLAGVWRETITARYLIPMAPSILLGVVLAVRASPRASLAYPALAALYLSSAIQPVLFQARPQRVVYGGEAASESLMRHGVRQVVFVWDHEATRILDPRSLQRLGGFFFRRVAYRAEVTALRVAPSSDVNRLALAAAQGPRPGIVWIFNRDGRTAARAAPPAITRLDAAWTCDDHSNGVYGAVACWRAPR